MKKLIIFIVLALIVGCTTVPVPVVQTVTVEKPVAFVPPPPEVPKFVSKVDQLTQADAANPGKVSQAYKYDTYTLRSLLAIYQSIISQYKLSSQNFDQVQQTIDKLKQSD